MMLYGSAEITLAGLNAQTDEDIDFMITGPSVGGITRVSLYLETDNPGLAYDVDSLSCEVFQRENVDATDPLSKGPHTVYRRTGIEPVTVANGGKAFDDNDFAEPQGCANQVSTQNGKISVRLKRTGGDGTSEEVYLFQIWGRED